MEVNNSNSFCVDINPVNKVPSISLPIDNDCIQTFSLPIDNDCIQTFSLPIDNDCIQTLINFLPTKDVTTFSRVCKNAKKNADIVILNRAKEAGFDPVKSELDSLYPAKANIYLKELYDQVKALYEKKVVIPLACIQHDGENNIDPEKTLQKLENLSNEDLLFIYIKETFYSPRYKLVKIFIDAHEKRRPAQPQLNEKLLKLFERDVGLAYSQGISSEILVKKGFNFININASRRVGKTLLHMAAKKGDCFFAEFLLKNKADINCLDNFLSNPLFEAVMFKKNDMVEFLLKKGSRVDFICSEGRTCLHYVKNVEAARLLVENGVNIDVVDKQGRTALDLAKVYARGRGINQ